METKNRVMSFDEFEATLQGGGEEPMESPEEVDFEGGELTPTNDVESGEEESGEEESGEEESGEEESGEEEIEDLDEE